LKEVDRIHIKNGDIQWIKNSGVLKTLISGLNGFLYINSSEKAEVNVTGRLFGSSSDDFYLRGNIFFNKQTLDVLAEIKHNQLEDGIPFLDSRSFSVKTALLDGTLKIHFPSFNIKEIDVQGQIAVKNMTAQLFGQRIRTEDFVITFSGQKMLLSKLEGQIEDGKFVLTGNLGEIFNPGIYFEVDFSRYSAKHIAISVPILKLLNRGKIQGKLNLNGPASHLKVTGRIFSPYLQYAIVPFYNASLDFVFEDGFWRFNNIFCHAVGMDHKGTGSIDFNRMTVMLNVLSYMNLPDQFFQIVDKLNGKRMEYRTSMTGDFNTLTFQGLIHAFFYGQQDTLLTADANYMLTDDHIKIVSLKSNPPDLNIYAEISNLWDDPNFDIVEMKNLPFDTLSSSGVIKWLSRNFQTDFYCSGPVNFPSVKVNLLNRVTLEPFFTFTGTTANLIQPQLKFNGRFSIQTSPHSINGFFKLSTIDSRAKFELDIPNIANGNLFIGYGENDTFSGALKFRNVKVSNFVGKVKVLANAISEGELNGEVIFTGSTNDPQILFDITGNNFIINQNGYYTTHFKGHFRREDFSFEEAWINYNNKPILEAEFALNPETDELEAHFRGNQIESNFLVATLFNDPELIRGKLKYEVTIQGDLNRPHISGLLQMQDGVMEDRAFSNLSINFADSIPSNATFFNLKKHIFKIYNFIYVDKKGYTIEANGMTAASPDGPIDLKVEVKGNVLAELPGIIEYFRNPVCNGKLFLHIAGSRENLKLNAGYLKIDSGSLEFDTVLPKLTDLKAEVELKEGEQFISIKYIEGKLLNHWVRIYNVPIVKVGQRELNPWYFEDLGLNFGILILETDPGGIPLSIPGLMNPGDVGYFAVTGKEENEKFYFAGPVEQPYVRGKIVLYDSRITFPFLISEDEKAESEESLVVDFLMNVNWDIWAISGGGNRYFVDIPALIGQVYMDLDIDDLSRGLEFSGRLVDESFKVEGEVVSTRGRVEYLDLNFRVDKFGAEFSRFELYPRVYGRAWTTVRDSTNFPRDIYLVLYAIDPETKQEVSRGRWEDFRFKLVSSDPTLTETQESVLAYLGYSVENITNKAGDVGLTLTENYLIRPLVRPLERKLERALKLDYIRLRSNITSNLFYLGFSNRFSFLQNTNFYHPVVNNNFDPALLLLQSSEITLGKYLVKDVYFTYSGQLVSIYDESKLGLNHRLGLEYRLWQNLLLEVEYDKFHFNPQFYSKQALEDFRIRLRHSFNF